MKAYGSLIACLALVSCQQPPEGLSAGDHAALQQASADWVTTYNQNNWNKLGTYFTENAVMMPPHQGPVRGRNAIMAWELENENGFRIAFQIENIEGSGKVAYIFGRSCVFIPNDSGGYDVDLGKFLETRKKQADGTWLMAADIFNSDLPSGVDLLSSCPFAPNPT